MPATSSRRAAPVSYARVFELWAGLLMADIAVLRTQLDGLMGDDGRRFLDFGNEGVQALDLAGVVGMHLERNAADLEWHSFLSDWDVLLTPTWTQPAFVHGADLTSADASMDVLVALRPVLPANLLGLPAAVVPCGIAGGLPSAPNSPLGASAISPRSPRRRRSRTPSGR